MASLQSIQKLITDSQVMSAATYPTAPYTGTLPTKTVKKGSKGASVKSVQTFLNWCIKAGLIVDGDCGSKTVSAIKKFQKQYGLTVDGCFGIQSKKKAEEIIKKYAVKILTKQEQMVQWAEKIAKDNSWHYVKWNKNDAKTRECPICKNHPEGKYHGFYCTMFTMAALKHGAGIKTKGCNALNNGKVDKIYNAKTIAEALKLAQEYTGVKNIKVIRSKSGIAQSKLQPGDMCYYYKGNSCQHAFLYVGNGYMIDANNYKDQAKQIAKRKAMPCKVAIRYTGK